MSPEELVPDYAIARYVGDGGLELFKTVGNTMVEWFRSQCGLRPDETVLEVGCGIGRIAIPLTKYLTSGRYCGFDIVPHGIEWCRQEITPRFPNFSFFLADVRNGAYRPDAGQPASRYVFPFADATFDFVFLTSVFTHMLPADVAHYTSEIGRVLKPGGRCFCTAYVISAEARRHLDAGESVRSFAPRPGGYWSTSAELPEAAIAYPDAYLAQVFTRAGMEIARITPGNWWAAEFAQDVLIARKKPAADALRHRLPRVTFRTARRVLRALRGLARPAAPHARAVDFVCNVCGHPNRRVPLDQVGNREHPSCASCHSSLRMRSVIHALSIELYGKPMILPEFPVDKSITGTGLSDWEGYWYRLAEKFSYVNTFYHDEPRLDIADIPDGAVGRNRFLISSDVFEHVPPAILGRAFLNSRRLLQDDGLFLLTVPFTKTGATQEHFPRLHDFRFVETRGKRFLYNRTIEGDEEIFDQLVFHGGPGATLEMRIFSEPDLRRHLADAGFSSVRICTENVPEFGIIWPMDWAVPVVARI